MLGGAFLFRSDSTTDVFSIARSVPRRFGGNLADSSSCDVLVPNRELFLVLGENIICFSLLFGVPAISISLPLALTVFAVAGRFVEVCFDACDGPFLGWRFWGSSSLPSHAGSRLDTLGIVHACLVTIYPSKWNAFDRRCDGFDCLKQKSLIK